MAPELAEAELASGGAGGLHYNLLPFLQSLSNGHPIAVGVAQGYAAVFETKGSFNPHHRLLKASLEGLLGHPKPKLALVYYNRGGAYRNLGQSQRAIQDYDEAIRLNPEFIEAYYSRGSIYDNLGQPHRAIQDYDEAIRLDPNLALAYSNRGLAYHNLGQPRRAIQDYDEALRLDPQDATFYNNPGHRLLKSR